MIPVQLATSKHLSAALSATVGLGNIAGVALAVALSVVPAPVFWMWVIGVLGMALKMTEVTQSMLTRDTSDSDKPHMVVQCTLLIVCLRKQAVGLAQPSVAFSVAHLILSAITGGNMFQAWNVAAVTTQYFEVPGVSEMEKDSDYFNPETFAIGVLLAIDCRVRHHWWY